MEVESRFPWVANRSTYRYLLQNHNSVLGIRDVAKDAGVEAQVITEDEVLAWLEQLEKLRQGFWTAFGPLLAAFWPLFGRFGARSAGF